MRVKVTLDGQPLPRGSVSLRSMFTGSMDQPTGAIGDGGEGDLYTSGRKGARKGEWRVFVFATEEIGGTSGAAHPGLPKSLVPVKHNDPKNFPLRLTVAEGASQPQPVELSSRDN